MKFSTRIGTAGLAAALATCLAAGVVAPVAGAGQAAPERRAKAPKVTLEASESDVVAGTKLVLSGKVKPGTKGGKVVIEKKVGASKWRAEATVKTRKKGAFRYVDKPGTPGTRLYRAVASRSGQAKAGTSKPVEVTVLRWRYLAVSPPRREEAVESNVLASINGEFLGMSVVSARDAASGWADWNLPADCTTLRVRAGAGDDGDEGSVAHLALAGDGESLFSGSFALKQSEVRTFDVSGVFRLAFSWVSTTGSSAEPTPGAQAVLGTPELLCAS